MENKVLKDIIEISKKVKGCALSTEILASNEGYFKRVETHFTLTRIQCIILVTIFELNSTNRNPDQADLAKHLKCNPMEFFLHK